MILKYDDFSRPFNITADSFVEVEKDLFSPLIFLALKNETYFIDTEINYEDLRANEID